MANKDELLTLADRYAVALGVPDITVSSRVFRDSKKIAALRGDADITLGRFNEAIEWFSANWPESVDWPGNIPRPPATGAAA